MSHHMPTPAMFPGVRATIAGTCARCDGPILQGAAIVLRRHDWIHAGCVSGADDE